MPIAFMYGLKSDVHFEVLKTFFSLIVNDFLLRKERIRNERRYNYFVPCVYMIELATNTRFLMIKNCIALSKNNMQ